MITVMGATGNTGRKIAESLLAAGVPVRALGRSKAKLAELAALGAEIRVGDTSDTAFLADAFRGADAAYTLLPTDQRAPDYPGRQDVEGRAIVHAVRASGVRRVVALSSVGTDQPEGTGVILGLRRQELRLRTTPDIDLYLLRPVSFFENFFGQLDTIRHDGVVADSVEADLAIPMVGSRDIAAAAVQALAGPAWSGIVIRELIGPRDLSYREATRILGERIGRPDLQYVQLPYEDMAAVLAQAGLSESFAEQYVGMTRAFNEATVQPRHGRTPENTTPTTFEAFADEFASAWRASGADSRAA
jgi:uncharacterized protein YbjT (DUF2867 family)